MTDDKLMNGANGAKPSFLKETEKEVAFGEGMEGASFPRLVFKGSRFRLRQGGEETVLPETELDVVILHDYPAISRILYPTGYKQGEEANPICASADGVTPLANTPEPQHPTCSGCPMDAVGSATTDDGRKSRACSFYKRIVMLIKGYEDVGPVVSDIRSMSLFGDSDPDHNMWNLKAYFQRLKKNDAYPYQIWTRISFDLNQSVPKVMFSAVGWLDEATYTDDVAPLINTPDGQLQLKQLVSTENVRFGSGADDGAQQRMLASDKPKHLQGPTNGPTETPAPAAVTEEPKPRKTRTRKAKEEAPQVAAVAAAPAPTAPPVAAPATSVANKTLEDVLADFDF